MNVTDKMIEAGCKAFLEVYGDPWSEPSDYYDEVKAALTAAALSASPAGVVKPSIIRLPWHKEPHSDFWRAEVIGHVYEVHDDEMADYKKRQCQYDFDARIMSAIEPAGVGVETPAPQPRASVPASLKGDEQ